MTCQELHMSRPKLQVEVISLFIKIPLSTFVHFLYFFLSTDYLTDFSIVDSRGESELISLLNVNRIQVDRKDGRRSNSRERDNMFRGDYLVIRYWEAGLPDDDIMVTNVEMKTFEAISKKIDSL
jgi:hypothetical protein